MLDVEADRLKIDQLHELIRQRELLILPLQARLFDNDEAIMRLRKEIKLTHRGHFDLSEAAKTERRALYAALNCQFDDEDIRALRTQRNKWKADISEAKRKIDKLNQSINITLRGRARRKATSVARV